MLEAHSNPNLKYPWQQTVLEALVEYPPVNDKIDAAEGAICARLDQRPTDAQEMLALREALFALEIVFPEIKPRVESYGPINPLLIPPAQPAAPPLAAPAPATPAPGPAK